MFWHSAKVSFRRTAKYCLDTHYFFLFIHSNCKTSDFRDMILMPYYIIIEMAKKDRSFLLLVEHERCRQIFGINHRFNYPLANQATESSILGEEEKKSTHQQSTIIRMVFLHLDVLSCKIHIYNSANSFRLKHKTAWKMICVFVVITLLECDDSSIAFNVNFPPLIPISKASDLLH